MQPKRRDNEVSLFGFRCIGCNKLTLPCLLGKNTFPIHTSIECNSCGIAYTVTLDSNSDTRVGRKENKVIHVLDVHREDLWE